MTAEAGTLPRVCSALAVSALAMMSAACGLLGDDDGAVGRPAGEPTTTSATADTRAGGYGRPTVLGRLSSPIVESSGVVASRRHPDVLWTHNDSGGDASIYCLTRQATACGVWTVTGATNFDWEDIAAGPGPLDGQPYLYVGDIGDNTGGRSSIVVYRVPEPDTDGRSARQASTATATPLRFTYPDGPHDAEALMIHPVSGDLYVVTKDEPAEVFKARAPLEGGATSRLEAVATVDLGFSLGPLGQVTGGDISPDGRRVILCTYVEGFEFVLEGGAGKESSFDRVWEQDPVPVDLGARPQGESVAYRADGKALIATSENAGSPLIEVARG